MEDLSCGYFVGFMERLVIERLPMIHHKVLFGISSSIIRLLMIRHQNIWDIVFRASFPLFGLGLDCQKQRNDRNVFKLLCDTKEALAKFKECFKSYIPGNILILKPDLEESVFYNESFKDSFKNCTPRSHKELLTKFKLEKDDCIRIAEKLKPENPSSNTDRKMNEGTHLNIVDGSEIQMDLFNSLDLLQKSQKLFAPPIFEYTCSYSSSEQNEVTKMFKIRIFPLIWEEQSTISIILSDITDHYNLINLKLADEKKDKVVTTVSHELRTPLNSILGMIQLMEKETTQPQFSRYLKICGSSAKLLLSLVNSILDLGQVKNNKLKLYPAKHKLRDLLNDIISLFDFQCQQKQLYLRLKPAKNLPKFIYTDKNRLAQIIINLVGNALKFTFEGGITIGVDQDTSNLNNLRFSVTDTGVGIKEQDKKNLFTMYGKLEGSDHMNTHGIGLGLHISNTLAKLLNEDAEGSGITVESEYEKGSTFSFQIKKNLSIGQKPLKEENTKTIKKSIWSECVRKPEKKEEMNKIQEESEIDQILNYERKEEENALNEQTDQEVIWGLSEKILRYCTLANSSQHNLESSRVIRHFHSNLKDSSVTLANLDQTYASPRMHLLSYTSPFAHEFRRRETLRQIKPPILIADDNAFNLMVAKELIEAQGLSAQTVLNGKLAIEEIIRRDNEKQPFKLVLMDCEMPVTDGFEATKELAKKMKKGEISIVPIIALTANSIDTIKEECIKAGMVDCLGKPLLEQELKTIIAKYM